MAPRRIWLTLAWVVAFTTAGCSAGVGGSAYAAPITSSPPSSATATAGASPSPSPTAVPAPLGDIWESRLVEAGAQVFAIAAAGSGWVAVGSRCAPPPPGCEQPITATWTSSDGRTWTRSSDLPGSIDDFTDIAVDAATVYIVSQTYEQHPDGAHTSAVVWRSIDGVAWESIGSADTFDLGLCYEGCPSIGSLAAAPAGVLFTAGRDLWFSPDGLSWERLKDEAVAMDRGQIAPWAGGFVRIGTAERGAAIWRSVDGRRWTGPQDLPAPRDLAEGEDLQPTRIAASDHRLVVLGSRCPAVPDTNCSSLTWTSDDALNWSVGSIAGQPFPGFITVSRGLFLVAGTIDGQWTAWTSTDGQTWSQRSSVGLPRSPEVKTDDGVEFGDLAGGPDGVILVPVDPAGWGLWFSEAP